MSQIKDRNRFNFCKCGQEKDMRSNACRPCWNAGTGRTGKYTSRPIGSKVKDDDGYVRIKVGRDYPGNILGWVKEHRYVMEQSLGRPLIQGETVHHKNGVRNDNHILNLELWTMSPYSGQRVEDLIIGAEEILKLYGSYNNEIGMVMC